MSFLRELLEGIGQAHRMAGDLGADRLRRPPGGASEEPIRDPLVEVGQRVLSLATDCTLRFGVIFSAVPQARSYQVAPAGGGPILPCAAGTSGSVGAVGVAGGLTLQAGTPVLYAQPPGSTFGVILCAVPGLRTDRRALRPDAIYQGLRSGVSADRGHRVPLLLPGGGGVAHRGGRTPADSVELSELCYVTETGLMLGLDPFLAQLRADEETGAFFFYLDQLTRLSGRNLEIRSRAWSVEAYDDEGELSARQGFAFHPWEALGRFRRGESFTETPDDAKGQARFEPGDPAAFPYHRLTSEAGLLHGGWRTLLTAPPAQGDWQAYGAADADPPLPAPIGLAEQVWTLAGSVGIRAAGTVVIGRRPAIAVPRRLRPVADDEGDKADEGYDPGAEPATAAPALDAEAADVAALSAVGVLDHHAHLFNWATARRYRAHAKDYAYPEETGATLAGEPVPDPAGLAANAFLKPPAPRKVWVDEEHGEVDYYPTSNAVSFLPDGSNYWHDGYGADIWSSGGHAGIDVPGDFRVRAGRDVILEAGRNVIIKARDAVDQTATQGSIRHKAEKHYQVIAANGKGPHGIFLDCRSEDAGVDFEASGEATAHGGIFLKAAKSQVVAYGKRAYIRTTEAGDLVIDLDKGLGKFVVQAAEIRQFLADRLAAFFGQEGLYAEGLEITRDGTTLPGELTLQGGLTAGGGGTFAGGLQVTNGHISTSQAESRGYLVGQLDFAAPVDTAPPQGQDEFDETFNGDAGLYVEGQVGHDDIVAKAAASLRTTQDYKTEKFAAFQPRWAAANAPPGRWSEKPVIGPDGTETFPFPGERAREAGSYLTRKAVLHDPATGAASDRGETYHDPRLDAWAGEETLDGGLPTIDPSED